MWYAEGRSESAADLHIRGEQRTAQEAVHAFIRRPHPLLPRHGGLATRQAQSAPAAAIFLHSHSEERSRATRRAVREIGRKRTSSTSTKS